MRQSHLALTKTTVSEDQTTGEPKRPHHVSKDGQYTGRKVTTATKKVKR
jgi:large subunit ribosomal protein L32